MKHVFQWIALFCGCWGVLSLSAAAASPYQLERRIKTRSAVELPQIVLNPSLAAWTFSRVAAQKIRCIPGRIRPRQFGLPDARKSGLPLSRRENRRKSRPQDHFPKINTDITLDVEGGYGSETTFIGQMRHGTQFKGAHYTMAGKWESTEGSGRRKEEEIVSARAAANFDLSKKGTFGVEGAYFQSDVELPQLSEGGRHKKSALQAVADLRLSVTPESPVELALGWERDAFSDHEGRDFTVNRYHGELIGKYLWGLNNALIAQAAGAIERAQQDDVRFDPTAFVSVGLLNSFVWHDVVVIEVGGRFDAYHAPEINARASLLTSAATARIRLGDRATLYANYHPSLKPPDFSELYIRTLYTAVNPDLSAETWRHAVEAGVQQRFGNSTILNLALFYHEREAAILRSDPAGEHLLEYVQAGNARFFGLKAGVQAHVLDKIVQNITYTYTDYEMDSMGGNALIDDDVVPYQPHHEAQASLSWRMPFGLTIDVQGKYLSKQYRNFRTEQARIGGHFLVNASVTQRVTENLHVYALGRNLTDTPTYDIIPALDSEEITSSRLFISGIRMRF